MPSTLVHLSLGALVAAALLGPAFGRRSLLAVLAVTAIPDLDAFAGLWVTGAHRAALHTAFLPVLVAVVLVVDLYVLEESTLRERWGGSGVRTAGVALVSLVFAGIAPDLVTNGVNLLYPVYDQFYTFSGELKYSTTDGIVQTFVDLSPASDGGGFTPVGSSEEVHYSTGVDPNSGAEEAGVEREFYLVTTGFNLLLVALGTVVTSVRLRDVRRDA